ncbi:MAG: heme ABC exporter ATP-binding protein CcmA [Sphingobium sp.]
MVTAHQLGCVRGGRLLFTGVSFALARGESLLLRGHNGVGKSSLLRLIAGLLPVFAGNLSAFERMAMCDEHLALDENRTLAGALSFWAHMDGVSDNAVSAALECYALTPLRDIPVRMLSTGQRKRAALVRVLASGALLWLLDEPGNGLDAPSLALLGAAMQAHVANGGCIIAASHFNLPFAFTDSITLQNPGEPDDAHL